MIGVYCQRLEAFADGELDPSELDAFGQHLGGCERCAESLEALFALRGLAESIPLPNGCQAAPETARATRRWSRWWLAAGLLAPAAAAAALLLVPGPRPTELAGAWVSGETRSLEARLLDPRADAYRPYDPMRGGIATPGGPDYSRLADLQARGDHSGLVNHALLAGDVASARQLLADGVLAAADLENERAVLALLDGDPARALEHLDRGVARDGAALQVTWNRALALRDLALPRAASKTFLVVANRGEGGWSDEAAQWARSLEQQARQRRTAFLVAQAAALELAQRAMAPEAGALERWPELFLPAFHEAVRTAASRTDAVALLPTARRLEDHFRDRTLVSYTLLVSRLDFQRRAPLARSYKALRASGLGQTPGPAVADQLRSFRRAGAVGRDLLLGLLLVGAGDKVDSLEEARRLARELRDPWLQLQVTRALAEAQPDGGPRGAKEAALRETIVLADRGGFGWAGLELEQALVEVWLEQRRWDEAARQAAHNHRRAQSLGAWPMEQQALAQLQRAAAARGRTSLARAYQEELGAEGADGRKTSPQ